MISKTIDISVTSVLQTTAGKMIFGRYDERMQQNPPTSGPERHEHKGRERSETAVGHER
jgi:hypothetical protein